MNDNFDTDLENDISEEEEQDIQTAPTQSPTNVDQKTEIVGIRFKKNGKTYYFDPNGFTLAQDERVIVDTSRGIEYGYAAVSNRMIKSSEISEPLRKVLRLATPQDTEIHNENLKKEIDAFNSCIALIDRHKLEMKLIDVELSFDRSKLLFCFSAEGRVDFRDLVKDLAAMFHTRIEMRQIGIRDEAKILGGLGICGRPYCCNTFLSDFGQVSVKMAKEQNLSLNSAKISGSCGRLMCCLRYEYDTYLLEKSLTPKVDTRVMTPSGAGVVVAANPLAGIVKVKLDGKAEDSEAVVFVREDVMDESKYDGRALTKTAIPDRKHKDDELPLISEFAVSDYTPSAVQEAKPAQEKNPEQKNDKKDQGAERKNDQKQDRKHDKNRDRKPEKKAENINNSDTGSNNADIAENNGSQSTRHNKKHRKNNRNDHKGNKPNGENNSPENRESVSNRPEKHQKSERPQNGERPQSQTQGEGGGNPNHRKNHKKPYYRHKNINRGNSENKPQ